MNCENQPKPKTVFLKTDSTNKSITDGTNTWMKLRGLVKAHAKFKRALHATLTVTTPDGLETILRIRKNNTVGCLKQQLEARLGLPASHQNWMAVCGGEQPLDNKKTAVSCGIHDKRGSHVFCIVDEVIKTSWSRDNLKFESEQVIQGIGNNHKPYLAVPSINTGVHTWTAHFMFRDSKQQKSTHVSVGAALATVDKTTPGWKNQRFWKVDLGDRHCFFAGRKHEHARSLGPDTITVPCSIAVTLDADEGTMSMVLNGESLGVLCTSLPKNQDINFAIGLNDANVKVALDPTCS
jgi:hypothetical protein